MGMECQQCTSRISTTDPRRRFCDPCRLARKRASYNQARKKWLAANPHIATQYRRRNSLMHKYGITLEQYDEMLQRQGGLCAIEQCGNPAIRVDHCHYTGVVRGLLCHGCNVRLSGLEDPDWRARADRYLQGGEVEMALTKHGVGEVLPEPDDQQSKTASNADQAQRAQELAAENAAADAPEEDQ